MVVVNTTFFGLAGSSLRLVSPPPALLVGSWSLEQSKQRDQAVFILVQGALLSTLWVAVMVWAARLIGIYSGSWLGGFLGGTPPEMRRRVWQGMVTQVLYSYTSARGKNDRCLFAAREWQKYAVATSVSVLMQAGVAMGLAKTVSTRFPSWGPEFATLMVRTTLPASKPEANILCLI